MLAIKECLIREGVLNLNPPVNPSQCNTSSQHPLQYDVNSPYNLYRNRYSFGSNLNMLNSLQKSTTDISVNDLSSANSATAKTSCQQQQQQQQQQEPLTKPTQTRKLPKRYQGHHPHFHHHTAPAYYTDLHLKIHTPEAKDSVNENYQSVYRTPSKLIKDEHQFPKTATATLAAPLPLSPTQKSAKEVEKLEKSSGSFFRAAPPNQQHDDKQRQPNRNDCSYMPSSSVLLRPTKGNSSSPCDFIVNAENLPLTGPADGSVVFACTNFKPCVTAAEQPPPPPPPATANRSRNSQRFASRKRAVRVRSESRPISALYDIICKEKGLDIATTTTNDEDSSNSHSREEEKSSIPRTRRSHSRSTSRPKKSSLNAMNMSGGLGNNNNNSSGGDQPQPRSLLTQKQKRHDKYSPNTICINDLSDDDEENDETNRLEGGCSRKNFRLRNSHKKNNLWDELEQAKSSSLPPGLNNKEKFMENQYNNSSHDSLNVKPETLVSTALPSLSNPSLSSSSNTALSVEPIHMHLSSRLLQESQSQSQPQPEQRIATASPKTDRYTRKHRRLRDEKPRRHTDGAIKLYPSQLNDNEDYDSEVVDDDVHRNNGSSNHHPTDHTSSSLLYHHDLNGAGHDFHNLTANTAANAKRYITRSQRTNESRSSPAIVAPLTEQETVTTATSQPNQQQQQEIQTNTETTTTATTTTTSRSPTTFETNGHTIKTNGEENTITTATASSEIEPVEDENKEIMTNNSGKKSKTTTATAAAAAATTATNAKELKLISEDDDTTATTKSSSITSTMAAAATTNAAAVCSSTTDKKKDEEKIQLQQHRYTSPTSPKPPHYAYHHHHHQHQHIKRASPASSPEQTQKPPSGGSESEHSKLSNSANSSPTHRANKKLIPSVSVSMKQNLSETQCTASRSNSLRSNNHSPKSPKLKSPPQTTECTVKITASPKTKTKSPSSSSSSPKSSQLNYNEDDLDEDFLEINELPLVDDGSPSSRPRCSTMYSEAERSKSLLSNGGQTETKLLELTPVHKSRTSNRSPRRNEERDKSSKRKSNLNRALNEEATPDGDDSAMRRRRRREMGMSRPLVPSDDHAVKALISPHKTRIPSPTKPAIRNDLSYHMEMARRGLDLATTSDRRRAQTASPKTTAKDSPSAQKATNAPRFSKRSDTVAIGDLRKERSSELNRKLNERTRTGLEEIMKIVENASDDSGSKPNNPCNPINDLTETMSRLSTSQEREQDNEKESNLESLKTLASSHSEDPRRPSPIKHATFVQGECIYYEPDPLEHIENNNSSGMLRSLRMLKAKSIERETAASEPPAKLSPILRRKSTDCPPNNSSVSGAGAIVAAATPNHIVSILKKKDHLSAGESSSASSNASPVTFSSNVMDTPSKHKRAGILKKRSSLDESRYYSRSHSPDERSILIKSARRNSLEEVANGSSSSSSAQGTSSHHGILKQSSYDSSKSDGCPSATREPHSILKKKDSTSTPSDGGDHAPKHVSISQAVILAAAELSAANENGDSYPNDELNFTPTNEEYDIKPILKLDSFKSDEPLKQPKPILKKKSSGDSDEHEIRPILKTSRKSSREEFEFSAAYSDGEIQQEPSVRPILKTDSPSKRRSLGEPDSSSNAEGEQREKLSPFMLKRRTRSLERQDQSPVIDLAAALNAIATSQDLPSELVSSLTNTTAGTNISVAERIKSVEKFLANQSGSVRSSTGDSSATTTNPPLSGAAVNTSWESPLQNDSASSGGVKILKPSVIRRDLYKDRFKTQPVTSDEKNFFKNNVSSTLHDDNSFINSGGVGGVANSSASAFKPAQSLEGLGFAHLSSHGYQSPNAPPSAFTLTRSFTQPLSSSLQTPPLLSSSFKTGVPVPLPRKSPPRSSRLCSNDTADNLTLSFTGDSSFSCNNTNSERIFEMSSLDQDIDMQENQEPQTPQINDNTSESAQPSASTGGVVRTNSVRARANMFQQLQEKTNSGAVLNREERTSPKRVPRRLSPSPATHADEPKTPNNPTSNPDDEIEPSSLPLSERLRFFSNLSGSSSKRNSCSFTRSSPAFNSIERSSSIGSYHYYMANTPRSSTSRSSASVTPTPTECALPLFTESPIVLKKEGLSAEANEVGTPETDLTDSRFAIKPDIVKTSPFLQAGKPISSPLPGPIAETETTPTSTLTPTMKRIKLKTVGKLMLPSTFLNNDRNNNSPKEPLSSVSTTSSTGESNNGTDNNENSGPPKKIGKIKSPFIENCNQKQQKLMLNNSRATKFDYNSKTTNSLMALASLENSAEHHSMDTSALNAGGGVAMRKYFNNSMQINGHHHHHHSFNEDLNTDSGKENVDTSLNEQTTPVVEIRRKFTRKANTSQSLNTSSTGISRQLTPRSASLNGPYTPSPVHDKYAKYFGVKSAKSSPAVKQQQQQQEQQHMVQDFGMQRENSSSSSSPFPSQAVNHNVRLWHSTGRGVKRMASVIHELKKFEDIVVTERELKLASKEFENLLSNETILKHSSKELDRIFSSIV